jgi:hypothetical protein
VLELDETVLAISISIFVDVPDTGSVRFNFGMSAILSF